MSHPGLPAGPVELAPGVPGFAEGHGPTIVILPPGLDDGAGWAAVAAQLAPERRVVRLTRRPYRTTPADGGVAGEVDDVVAVAEAEGAPVVLVGHSSGGVVALEALLARPASFLGALLYEPPVPIDEPLGGPGGAIIGRARTLVDAGKPGRALAVFLAEIVRIPPLLAQIAGRLTALSAVYRTRIDGQVRDVEAIDALGLRLEAYGRVTAPVALLSGGRSPAHLGRRLDALATVLPASCRIDRLAWGHDANRRAPADLARIVLDFDRAVRASGAP